MVNQIDFQIQLEENIVHKDHDQEPVYEAIDDVDPVFVVGNHQYEEIPEQNNNGFRASLRRFTALFHR